MTIAPLLAFLLLGCPAEPDPTPPQTPSEPGSPAESWAGAIESMELDVDLRDLSATATVQTLGAGRAASFSASGLDIASVEDAIGPLPFEFTDGRLDVGLRGDAPGQDLAIRYDFAEADRFEGWFGASTVTWPTHCGNLFPCRPEPHLGLRADLDVTPANGLTAVAPSLVAPGPAYQVAFAQGTYDVLDLGTSDGGVALSVHHFPQDAARAAEGAAGLVEIFSWLESTLGPYPYGDDAGAVEVEWGPGAFGGIEHHPRWYISSAAIADVTTQAHEAAHGWFGTGLRLRCWEDLVLSEGTATWLAARAQGVVLGDAAGQAVWDGYASEFSGFGDVSGELAWIAEGCNAEDPIAGRLRTRAPYIKGAFFYRAVAEEVGVDALDAVLGGFFADHVGAAAGMQDLLDRIAEDTGFDPADLARDWLLSTELPPGFP